MERASRVAFAALLFVAVVAAPVAARDTAQQTKPEPAPPSQSPPASETEQPAPTADPDEPTTPQGLEWLDSSFDRMVQTEEGDLLLTGQVEITWKGNRFQADTVSVKERRYLEADGSVLVLWDGNRISGTRMTYDLETDQGVIENAIGQVEDEYLFWARSAEKIGKDRIRLRKATVTACTQPLPYWSFSVSRATIRINGYARMWNVRLRTGRMPLIYLPFIVWPVKKDRAAGLLLPEFQATQNRGRAISEQLFIPLGPSADLTLLGRYYTTAGFGGGGELRFVPNQNGSATFNGFYIFDEVVQRDRYRAEYRQTQQFKNGFNMVADINLVSDFDYFSDFERDLNLVSSPTILARVDLSRNGKWTSMNIRELRREQLYADGSSLIQQTLPEIEFRGRSHKLGRSPFYLSYESSLASIQQRDNPCDTVFCQPPAPGQSIDVDYLRGDAFPTISVPWSPVPWLDITPSVNYRITHYTQRQDQITTPTGLTQRVFLDDSLTRQLWGAGLDITGPKLFKIYERPDSQFSPRYKHSIEARVNYGYRDAFERADKIIVYDEVDQFSGAGNQVNYGIVQRLFAQRPQSRPVPAPERVDSIVLPDGPTARVDSLDRLDPALDPARSGPVPDGPREAVEIASFEISQTRTFDTDLNLSTADLDGDGIDEATSQSSSIFLTGRLNPTPRTSIDLRSSYHTLYSEFGEVTLSGTVMNRIAHVNFSFVHRNGLGAQLDQAATAATGNTVQIFEDRPNDTQLRLTTGLTFFQGKLQLDLDGSYDADPAAGQTHVPDKRWRIRYSTQCCSISLERLNRDYSTSDRNDFYFRIDFKGIGKILKASF